MPRGAVELLPAGADGLLAPLSLRLPAPWAGAQGLAGDRLAPPSSSPARRATLALTFPRFFPLLFLFAVGETNILPLQPLLFTRGKGLFAFHFCNALLDLA
jgi:hypothetical protein